MSETDDSGPVDRTGGKTELVCPTCGRTAPLDGDWAVTERKRGHRQELAYECPECGTVLVAQPRFGRTEHARLA